MAINEGGPIFAEEHGLRVLALDAPGFGSSPALEPSAYHPHALADLVPRLLDALDLDRTPFVGFSWGGDIGCHVAALHPDRLTALVLLDAGYADPPFDASQPFEDYAEARPRRPSRPGSGPRRGLASREGLAARISPTAGLGP
jgi:pimeloyl-ACP methyl ester carboxylesterase